MDPTQQIDPQTIMMLKALAGNGGMTPPAAPMDGMTPPSPDIAAAQNGSLGIGGMQQPMMPAQNMQASGQLPGQGMLSQMPPGY